MKNVLGGSGDVFCGGYGGCSGGCSYNGRSGHCTVREGQCGCLIN